MEVFDMEQEGNKLKALFDYSKGYQKRITMIESSCLIICNTVNFQFGVIPNYFSTDKSTFIFVRIVETESDSAQFNLSISSDALLIPMIELHSADGLWQLIHAKKKTDMAFDITATVKILVPRGSSWAALYEDLDFVDFRLRSQDGSVMAHRAALAAASPVLQRMLAGEWKEAAEGALDLQGTSKAALMDLKRYIYLREIPDTYTGLKQLLLLATYYIMPELEKICEFNLLSTLSSDNALDMLEFSMAHKQTKLVINILCIIREHTFDMDKMCENAIGKIKI